MSSKIIEQLAPKGVLRVAINLSNFLLVTDRSAEGNPAGVSPDMAAEVARRLGVGIEYVEYKTPGEIADDAGKDVWDIANIGAEPQRAEKIDFTRAYCEIQATYLVPPGSPLKSIERLTDPVCASRFLREVPMIFGYHGTFSLQSWFGPKDSTPPTNCLSTKSWMHLLG